MKKLFGLLAIFAFTLTVTPTVVNAQTYQKLYTGAAGDTLVTSATIYKVVNLNQATVPIVTVQVLVDAYSGTPKGTATLYWSNDGINWKTSGVATTWSTGVDSVFNLTSTAFYGTYCKVNFTATSSTGKAKISATLKSWAK